MMTLIMYHDTDGFKNYTKNLINFHASSHKSENLHFDGPVLSISYIVLDGKLKKKDE